MASPTSYDPLLLSGSEILTDFCRKAIHSGPSKNASSTISKIELLKDTRVAEHWTHEYLVFTVIPAGSGSTEQQVPGAVALYFERGLSDEDSSWLEFIRVGFSGEAEDTLEFYEAGGEDDRYRRGWSTSVFEVTLRSTHSGPLKLRHLAQLLEDESYAEKYPLYGLFTANCWSWSRGVFLDIIRHPRLSAKEILSFKDGSVSALRKDGEDLGGDVTAMNKEELQLFVVTQYGAYGRALLHFTSDGFRARYPSVISQYFVRVIIAAYCLVGLATAVKHHLRHSSNWAVCLRSILVRPDKTVDDSGRDLTSTFLPPNFTKLVPWTSAFRDASATNSLCGKGRCLHLLTSPLTMSPGSSISSIYVFVFGYIRPSVTEEKVVVSGNSSKDEEDSESRVDLSRVWLSCAVIRPSRDRTHILHMGSNHPLRLIPRTDQKSDIHYSAIYSFNSDHPLTKAIVPGDVIGVWAHTHDGATHIPRISSAKVVARRPIGILDILFVVYVTWEMQQLMLVGPSIRAFQGFLMCLPYILSVRFEDWVWGNLSTFAKNLHNHVSSRKTKHYE